MTPEIFDTAQLAPEQQFEDWMEWWSGFTAQTPVATDKGFRASRRTWHLGDFGLARVSAPPLRVVRSRDHIRRDPYDHWNICIGLGAATQLTYRSGAIIVPPRIPFVVSLGEEMVSERAQDDRVQLYLPRDRFRELAPLLDSSTADALGSPMRGMLADFILALEGRLPELAESDLPRLTQAISAMVAACIEPSKGRLGASAGQIDFTRMEKIRRVARAHLRSPDLSPDLLCRLVGVSRSHLYRLLEREGGVSRWIRRQRLLASHALLSDVSQTGTISAIAYEFGFADAATFSRAFRREFGVSPRDVRTAALAGTAVPMTDRGNPPAVHSLDDLLRAA
ncbi:helix-turn-helix domain-containing protein [Roseomonas sp. OT10]|uniref:helix-turn-helix domain-containing protein n=1 Tax=Roseomonas cutis TaxID=2897332 RepID=UPI001E4F7CB6|nr:helix-turn-helix domain-containing protein [Roseomonas sp. OT10]UFN48710.1 helix-turn-helix domain-containing protein [Roseomonas sp. OT10]